MTGAVSVTLLSAPNCELCDHAKGVLARVGKDHALAVEVISVESPQGQELAAAHPIAFPPGVLLDGRPFSYGRLSERKLRAELERLAR